MFSPARTAEPKSIPIHFTQPGDHAAEAVGVVIGARDLAQPVVAAGIQVAGGLGGRFGNRLQSLGARFSPLKNGTQNLGEAAILPPTGALTLAERERQAIADTLQDTSGKLAETARRLGISRTTLWRRLKSYGMDGFRASP